MLACLAFSYMPYEHTFTIIISWSLSELTWTWHIAVADIKKVSRNLPVWNTDIIFSRIRCCLPYDLVNQFLILYINATFRQILIYIGFCETTKKRDTKDTKSHNFLYSLEAIDQSKLQEFLGKVMFDVGAAMSAVLVNIGDRLGLYKAIANAKGLSTTVEESARNTGVEERCVREWLANQAASGYILYDSNTKKYSLPKEHALVFSRR